jgi:hypothetical protein
MCCIDFAHTGDKKLLSGRICCGGKSGEHQVYPQRIQRQNRYSWHRLWLLFFPKYFLRNLPTVQAITSMFPKSSNKTIKWADKEQVF